MCGITGLFNINYADKIVLKQLDLLRNRGKDFFGICNEKDAVYDKELNNLNIQGNNILAHTLHSIVGDKIPQPFVGKGKLVANCEIYNWKELDKKFDFDCKNDSELLFNLLENNPVEEVLDMLDGVYAFAYWKDGKIYVARDIIGEKPLFIYHKDKFLFASEKKVLAKTLGNKEYHDIEELNPRLLLKYCIKTNKLEKIKRNFFDIFPEITEDEENIIDEIIIKLKQAIKKRIPDQKFGILFSGGIDSTIIAFIAKQLGKDFICYTSALEHGNFSKSQDLDFAEEIAKRYGFALKAAKLNLTEVEEKLKVLLPLIESSNVIKAGVGLTMFAACEQAKKDKIRVIFSGLGSEEIFGGYERHKLSSNVNKECLAGLRKLYERDTYRDDVITMYNDIELRSPFLDLDLIEYSLKIPSKYKIDDKGCKIVLRKASEKLGLDKRYAFRKKVAAQYGSKLHKAIQKLAGKEKKSEYLKRFYGPVNQKLGVLWSSGKDSAYAAYTMNQMNYELTCLISIKSKNPDSYMFHTPNINLVEKQAEAMEFPLIIEETEGKKEIELDDLRKAIEKAKQEYNIDGIVTGALYSDYQRQRIEKICEQLGLKVFSPLWHIDQELEMRSVIKNNFEIIFSSIAAYGLDKTWLGKIITNKEIDKLSELNNNIGLNIAGEGGEFESLVLDCPLFMKKIIVKDAYIQEENQNTARYIIDDVELKHKE